MPWCVGVHQQLSAPQATHINQQIRGSFAQKEAEDCKPEGLADNGKLCESFSSQLFEGSPDQRSSEVPTPAISNMIEPAMLLDRTADVIDVGLVLRRPTRKGPIHFTLLLFLYDSLFWLSSIGLYGHPGIVLEVTEDDDVETVWLF
jgi:hypothetical protein